MIDGKLSLENEALFPVIDAVNSHMLSLSKTLAEGPSRKGKVVLEIPIELKPKRFIGTEETSEYEIILAYKVKSMTESVKHETKKDLQDNLCLNFDDNGDAMIFNSYEQVNFDGKSATAADDEDDDIELRPEDHPSGRRLLQSGVIPTDSDVTDDYNVVDDTDELPLNYECDFDDNGDDNNEDNDEE